MSPMTKYVQKSKHKVVGTRPIRHDGADKVTGRAVYTADFQIAGLTHGKILRSPHAHALIKSIDTSAAERLPGVYAVATGADWPNLEGKIADLGEGSVSLTDLSHNLLACGKVLYKGHAVAAVSAKDVHTAEEAIGLIKVEYEPLPSVHWICDAMEDGAPILHESLRTDSMGKKGDKPTNIATHLHFEKGDIEAGFAEADVVIEREFKTASVHQGYIESHVSTALWNEDDSLKIWTSTQGSFTCRQQTAELLQIPVSSVNVTPCEIGGGFGGKIAVYVEPVAAILSRKSGRPVKIVLQRDECFEGTGPTPGSFMRVKLGATKDGRLTAGQAYLAYDAGAYPGGMLGPGCMCVFSCYDLPNADISGDDVVLNKPKTQAYRAPGATQAAFACESVVDELAIALKIDPIEFRLKNAAVEGTRRADGPVYPRVGFVETLEAAKASEHWNTPLDGPNQGRGVASGFWFNIGLKSSAAGNVNPDGTVTLIIGSTDIGGSRASLAMQLAETLGITAEEVRPQVTDTDSVGYNDVTGGSRTTFATGLAAYKVGIDIQEQLAKRAALLWDCNAEDVKVDENIYSCGNNSITFKELSSRLHETGGPVVGRATISADVTTDAFGTILVDVEVDPETGKTTILRFTAIQDAGKAIHPSYVEGQMQGGAVQGIGWALNEEYIFDENSQMENPNFLDYRMPTCFDVPMIDTIIVEVPNTDHPYGVRGVGETPIVAPPAAIANAIHAATNIRMLELPISPPRLWKAINEQGS